MVLDRRRGRKTRRNRPPLASGVEHELDRVEDLAEVGRAGPPLFAGGGRNGSIKDHSSSVKSLPNQPRGRVYRVLMVSFQGMSGILLSGFQMTKYATSWRGHSIFVQALKINAGADTGQSHFKLPRLALPCHDKYIITTGRFSPSKHAAGRL